VAVGIHGIRSFTGPYYGLVDRVLFPSRVVFPECQGIHGTDVLVCLFNDHFDSGLKKPVLDLVDKLRFGDRCGSLYPSDGVGVCSRPGLNCSGDNSQGPGPPGPLGAEESIDAPIKRLPCGWALTVLLYLPSIEVVFNQIMFHPSKSTSVMTERLNPVWTVVEILRSFGEITPLLLPSVIVALGLMAIGMVSLLRKQAIIPILFLLHIILMVTLLLALSMRIWPRFFLIDMGFVLFFITEGVFICSQYISRVLKHFTSWKISGNILFVSLSAVMLIISSGMLLKNYQFPKQDFEAAAKFLKEKQVGENINAIGPGAARFFTEHYGVDSRNIKSVDDLKLSEESSDITWVVMTFPNQTARSHVAVMEHLEKNYFLAKTFRGTMGDGNVLIYRNNQVTE
jgi:hypothetical protein